MSLLEQIEAEYDRLDAMTEVKPEDMLKATLGEEWAAIVGYAFDRLHSQIERGHLPKMDDAQMIWAAVQWVSSFSVGRSVGQTEFSLRDGIH